MRFHRLFFAFFVFCISAIGQSSPFLPDATYQKLVNEISGDNAYDHLRNLTQYHSPRGVDRDFKRAAAWIAGKAKEAGLEDVHFISLPSKRVPWSPISAEAWLIETTIKDGQSIVRETKLGSFREVATVLADNSRPTNLQADLIDVGTGLTDKDYEGKDVKGKIVLASGSPARVEEEAVWKRGAVGILSYTSSRTVPIDFPDQIAWTRINEKGKDGHEPSFAFVISPRRGGEIRDRLNPAPAATNAAPPPTFRVRVKIESEILPESTQGIVEGWIRGSKNHDQQVVLTSHIQEERFSANDNRSGCANMLEIARALNRMIADGTLPRPERDIRFWWVNEIDGPYTYFALNPDEAKKTFVNINQDMVGTNQTVGKASRVQHVSRTPWSRPTFFNDVVESVITALYQGNNAYIVASQAGSITRGSLYSKPIFSLLGSRDRYSVEIIPHMNNTDHMVFSDGYIGTTHGGITFTNWPDDYIHSSDDDMWQMDRTTFKRNAVAVTALAWFMANVGAKDAETILNMVQPGAMIRLAQDRRNLEIAFQEKRADAGDNWKVAYQGAVRERGVIDSVATVSPGDRELAAKLAKALTMIQMPGKPNPDQRPEMTSKVPVRASIKDYRDKIDNMKRVEHLHPVMAYEALNFADGKRTVWDIYAALRAESLATGEWYYGHVTPEMVAELFQNAGKAGILVLKDAPTAVPGAPAAQSHPAPKK